MAIDEVRRVILDLLVDLFPGFELADDVGGEPAVVHAIHRGVAGQGGGTTNDNDGVSLFLGGSVTSTGSSLITVQGKARRELLHKTYAEAVVSLDTPEVLALPRSAVLHTGDRAVVYVDKGGGAYEQRRVKLGRAGDEHWEILDGVKDGERVVTTGNLLIDGQAQLNSQATETVSAPAAPAPAHQHTQSLPPGVKPYPLDVCIVGGEKLGSMGEPVSFIYQGQQVKFCCGGCQPEFEKDPAKFLKKLSALTTNAVPQNPNPPPK